MQSIVTVDSEFYQLLGLEIRKARQERRITLKELSSLTGFSRPLLDRWELGISKIKKQQYEVLCKALNINPKINIHVSIEVFL